MDDLLASLLRQELPWFRLPESPETQALFVERAAAHGVDSLVRRELQRRGVWSSIPLGMAAALDERARRDSVLEILRRREMTRMLGALQQAGVEALVLKGWGLAYTHYPEAYLRPRSDADLLVKKEDVDSAVAKLGEWGYTRINSPSRETVRTQWSFERRASYVRHVVDLHWAISNRPLFADMMSFEELARSAVPIAAIGPRVRTPGPVQALLLACIHRIAHHDDSDLLFWLYDIKLLADSLSPEEWELFRGLAAQKGIAVICQEGLRLAAHRVGCGERVRQRIAELTVPVQASAEPSAAYLGGVGSRFRSLTLDLRATAGAAAKLRRVAGHAFPDAVFMRNASGATNRFTLAMAYVRRAARGLWRMVSE